MSDIKINEVFVDEAYSTMFIENLRPNSFLIDGVTYNSNFAKGDPKAGVVWFNKLNLDVKESEVVGLDYTADELGNKHVPIYLTNAFRDSKKLRGVTAAQINAAYKDKVASEQALNIKQGIDKTAIAAIVFGGTTSTDTAELTKETIIEKIIDGQVELAKKNVTPNVILVSPTVAGLLNKAHLTQGIYTPVTNDALLKAGVIGSYLGMYVFARPELGAAANSAVKYRDSELRTVDLSKVEFVMYNALQFGKIDSYEEARIVPTTRFAGMLANIEQNTGMAVVNSDAVLVKKYAVVTPPAQG